MLSAIARRRRPEGRPESLPAPVYGWNTVDPIGDMHPKYALDMENFFPTPADVMLRQGFADHVTSIANGQVESLMAYSSPTGTEALYGAAGTAIYNCTQATATASVAVSGLTNARWSHTNFTNSGGTSYLLAVNGADGLRAFDGSSWSTLSITGTGASASNFNHISQHKRRIWFVKDQTLQAYFLNADAVSGTATAVDLSGFARKGGELVATATWTLDAGEGMDDYWVAVTSEGEIIVYKGTDPSAASTWVMVGRWEVGRPIGNRCFAKFGGDLLYLADDGIWPLAKLLITERSKPGVALTNKIADAIRKAADSYRSNFGWQLVFWPRNTMVLANIPVATGSSQQQYIMNSITKAWCYFTGISANCFEVYGGNMYFGGNGFVSRFWSTFADDGVAITGEAKQAFNYLKGNQQKQITMARPILNTNGAPTTSFGVNVDYDDDDNLGTLSFSPTSYGVWDTATWDNGIWGGGLNVNRNWVTVSGIGFAVAPRLKVQSSGIETHWIATDLLVKDGGVL